MTTERTRPHRVLIVDDDLAIVAGIARVLRRTPDAFVVETVAEPQIAMTRLRAFKPDLVLLDAIMPGCNGAELSRRIHELGDLPIPKVVVLTGYPRDQLPETEIPDADLFLSKPIEAGVLVRSINELLNGDSGAYR